MKILESDFDELGNWLHDFGWASFRRGMLCVIGIEAALGAIVLFLYLGGWIK